MIERLIQSVILRLDAAPRDARGHRGLYRIGEKSMPLRLPVVDRPPHLDHVDAADHFVDGAEAELAMYSAPVRQGRRRN